MVSLPRRAPPPPPAPRSASAVSRWAIAACVLAFVAGLVGGHLLTPRVPAAPQLQPPGQPQPEPQPQPTPQPQPPDAHPAPAPLEVFFSPKGGIRDRIIREINLCRKSIDICVYSIDNGAVAQALKEAKSRGRTIRIITDASQAKGKYSEIGFLKQNGIPVTVTSGMNGGLMHDKFAIFDGTLLLTGSYNWSEGAEDKNRENAIFIRDAETIGRYREEFEAIWEGKK